MKNSTEKERRHANILLKSFLPFFTSPQLFSMCCESIKNQGKKSALTSTRNKKDRKHEYKERKWK